MLPIEARVFLWRSPSVSLCACSASSSSGLASFSWPILYNIAPNWLSSVDVPRSAAGSRASAARP
eukprot:scaffold65224_cov55-Phaeocystis_antarctica.AAC.1